VIGSVMIVPRKYTEALEVAQDLYRHHPAEVDYGVMAGVLQNILDTPVCTFSEVDFSQDGALGLGWPETTVPSSEITAVTRRNMRRHPLIRHYVNTTDRRPLAVTDFVSLRRWKSSAVGSDIHEATQMYDHLAIPLDSPVGTMRSFALGRPDQAFTGQDRQFVLALHPLLYALDLKAQRLQRAAPDTLTAREAQILHLVRTGLTSRQIATRLDVSSRTVEKHLQTIYRKLGVSNRIDAIARLAETGRTEDDGDDAARGRGGGIGENVCARHRQGGHDARHEQDRGR
jgi:DNA-binding CsgD family transcriptional regulator